MRVEERHIGEFSQHRWWFKNSAVSMTFAMENSIIISNSSYVLLHSLVSSEKSSTSQNVSVLESSGSSDVIWLTCFLPFQVITTGPVYKGCIGTTKLTLSFLH